MLGARAYRSHWLITKYDHGKMNILTIGISGGNEALAVFAFEEEAEMFLHLRRAALGKEWGVRQTSVGELVSVLYGPCANSKEVAMDPAPEVGKKKLAGSLRMPRKHFLRILLGEGPSGLHLVPSRTPGPLTRLERSGIA